MKVKAIMAGMVLALSAGAAQAAMLPDGGVTAQEVARALQAKGYRAELDRDAAGDPMIRSALDGSNFQILFYDCEKGRCVSIQFVTAFELEKDLTFSKINEWNRTKRFGRAYLDEEMDPFVEMDLDLEHGATSEAIENNIDTWAAVLPAFKNFIDF